MTRKTKKFAPSHRAVLVHPERIRSVQTVTHSTWSPSAVARIVGQGHITRANGRVAYLSSSDPTAPYNLLGSTLLEHLAGASIEVRGPLLILGKTHGRGLCGLEPSRVDELREIVSAVTETLATALELRARGMLEFSMDLPDFVDLWAHAVDGSR